jgi:hypothetical protein
VGVAPQRRALVDGVLHRDGQQHHALPVVDVQLLHLRGCTGWGLVIGQEAGSLHQHCSCCAASEASTLDMLRL